MSKVVLLLLLSSFCFIWLLLWLASFVWSTYLVSSIDIYPSVISILMIHYFKFGDVWNSNNLTITWIEVGLRIMKSIMAFLPNKMINVWIVVRMFRMFHYKTLNKAKIVFVLMKKCVFQSHSCSNFISLLHSECFRGEEVTITSGLSSRLKLWIVNGDAKQFFAHRLELINRITSSLDSKFMLEMQIMCNILAVWLINLNDLLKFVKKIIK